MKDRSDNFSLLSQKEVDVLVSFLTKNNGVDSDVLSQESVDKLVYLLNGHLGSAHLELYDPFVKPLKDVIAERGLRTDGDEICELTFSVKEDGKLQLRAVNKNTGKEMDITPKIFDDKEIVDEWGCSMSPATFNRLARVLGLKYTADTYDGICKIFAQHNYGDKNAHLPALYYPTNEHLVVTMLSV